MKGLEFLETDPNQLWDHDANKEDRGMLIPRILHHVFLDGEDEYTRMTEKAKLEGSGMRREWKDSCISHHSNWTYMFWDKAAAVELLRSRYPWFTKTFLLYEFVSEFSGEADVNNAVVASVPGHPFWNAVIRNITLGARTADETNILSTTGPWVWREAFRPWVEITRSHPPYGGEYVVHGAHIKYYPLGEWFNPCTYADEACHARVDRDAAAGRADPLLAGHHKFKSSWIPVVDAAGDAKATAKAQAEKEEFAKKEERAKKEEVAKEEELTKANAAEEGAAEDEAAGQADDKRGS
ncbi:hypothetical protein WJX75_005009 [Coccomyxa subellipsoidea]|uniref:Uncharacterized protein n=1 Tax=Coccomyxa subellipsoidea TaxID=248742 RepID=A0ABR2Z4J2_9CHLO